MVLRYVQIFPTTTSCIQWHQYILVSWKTVQNWLSWSRNSGGINAKIVTSDFDIHSPFQRPCGVLKGVPIPRFDSKCIVRFRNLLLLQETKASRSCVIARTLMGACQNDDAYKFNSLDPKKILALGQVSSSNFAAFWLVEPIDPINNKNVWPLF